jgi:YidC/Oxa1 family membrane protein insertase
MQIIISIFTELLITLYSVTGNLGLAIIGFTLLTRAILLPLTLPSLKAQKKMREIQPEVKKLKDKHGANKQAFQAAQLELYKKYNINPLAGCLPQILQLGVLIFLYQALLKFLGTTEINGVTVNPSFLWLNLSVADKLYILPLLTGVTQLILSLMILPGGEVRDIVPNDAKSKKLQTENKKEEDMAEMAANMQQQMLFIMPVMTGFLALSFPSGLALYWVVTTLFSIGQQYFLSGPGGLTLYARRALAFVQRRRGA